MTTIFEGAIATMDVTIRGSKEVRASFEKFFCNFKDKCEYEGETVFAFDHSKVLEKDIRTWLACSIRKGLIDGVDIKPDQTTLELKKPLAYRVKMSVGKDVFFHHTKECRPNIGSTPPSYHPLNVGLITDPEHIKDKVCFYCNEPL